VKLDKFGGMIPAIDDALLPPNAASLAQNTWLYAGLLQGLPEAKVVFTLTDPASAKAFRIPKAKYGKDNIPDSYWLEFNTTAVDIVASPAAYDTFERYYWAGVGIPPTYNTRSRIAAGQLPFKLGIPAPSVAPGVSVAGGAAPVETRVYVYTWVSAYNEEGPPSPPTTQSGNASGTWNITMSAPLVGDTTDRALATTRIYRTVTGSGGSTAYYFVAEVPIDTLAYADTVPTAQVTAQGIIQSTFWEMPPNDLIGLAAMPNGMIAGFRENEVWFCEPYHPHAWPSLYTVPLDATIMGLGVIDQTLVAATRVSPFTISGVNPASMSTSKIATHEPCMSRGSIVSTAGGVVYGSPNGLVLIAPGIAEVITKNIITKDKWQDRDTYLNPDTLQASSLNGAYYAWGATDTGAFEPTAFDNDSFEMLDFGGSYIGLILDPKDARVAYTKLFSELPAVSCFPDPWSGETFVIREGAVLHIDISPNRPREPYTWRSKRLERPKTGNYAAMKVYFTPVPDLPPTSPLTTYWDDDLFWDDSMYWTEATLELRPDQQGIVRVYADDRIVWARELRHSGEQMRMPSGFKATDWYVEIDARCTVSSIEMVENAKEFTEA